MTNSALKKLEGKVAIVTSDASSIGEETARCFSSHDAKVVIADIQDEKGRDLVESIGSCCCTYICCDVADEQQFNCIISWTSFTAMLECSVLSNKTFLILTCRLSSAIFAINAKGVASCVKHGARTMVDKDIKGSIICTANIAATIGSDEYID
ncbi:hypothetical protein NL676_028885 [Syzygium grande]|nr:hypothetical protein NL676_028885 [Syzygium grande]